MSGGSESTIICVDNSDYNINEDLYPDRLISLKDCIHIICENKIVSHDHHVGVLLMAGEPCKVLVALTNSLGKLLNCLHDIKVDGTCDLLKSLAIAQLALKHRINRSSQQKIVLLIGSPCKANEKQLMTLAKQLKKNNIGIEIVNYGSTAINKDILTKLYEAVNNDGNSKYIEVPENETNVSSYILNSFSNQNYCNFDDMNMNPDIYNTVQEALAENTSVGGDMQQNGTTGESNVAATTNAGASSNPHDLPTMEEIQNMQDIDNDLREALLLSLREYNERQLEAAEEAKNENEISTDIPGEENATKENNVANDDGNDNTNTIGNAETNTSIPREEEQKENDGEQK